MYKYKQTYEQKQGSRCQSGDQAGGSKGRQSGYGVCKVEAGMAVGMEGVGGGGKLTI